MVWIETRDVVDRARKRSKTSVLPTVLRVIVSLALLVVLLRGFDLPRIGETLGKANVGYMAAALGLYLLGVLICALRWGVLLGAYDVRVPLPALTALYFVGVFFSNVLPGSVSGDVVKAYQLSRYSERSDVAVSTVLMDRLTGFLALFAIAAGAVVFAHDLVPWQTSVLILVIAVGLWGGIWLLSAKRLWRRLSERIGLLRRIVESDRVAKVYRAMKAYDRRTTLYALGISLVFDVTWILVRYLIALALGVDLSIWYFLLFIPIVSFVTLVPISFSGLGIREGAYVYLFSQVGVDAATSVAMSLAFYALRLVGGLIGGVIYALGAGTYLGERKSGQPVSECPQAGAEGMESASSPVGVAGRVQENDDCDRERGVVGGTPNTT